MLILPRCRTSSYWNPLLPMTDELYFNQILTVALEVLDDIDSSIRELTLSLIGEMLKNQKEAMEESVEIVIEKLLHVTKDTVSKMEFVERHCVTLVLSQYDPLRCLSVIVPLLVTEDEKTLVTCINCLTKIVGRLSQEELMMQLPTFLQSLFDAFGNPSADVRKTVVFCLVDIYIMLGKAFLPYLGGLNSTQLRLVTIYANRISQACEQGTPMSASHMIRIPFSVVDLYKAVCSFSNWSGLILLLFFHIFVYYFLFPTIGF
ncbi:hypothetical protein Leryth_021336 [Lithospermum erythrorhizon]|nr:hypothetical protein Leryth_021336 [Lithospermum erythrorhizon]